MTMLRALAALALLTGLVAESRAAVFVPTYDQDAPDRGFLDPTPVQPVGGNPGTSVGQQRRIVFEHAMAVFAGRLQSTQQVRVLATFNGEDLPCTSTAAVLGGAAADHAILFNAPNARPNVLYHAALADSLAGKDGSAGDPDVVAHFNGRIGSPGCGDDMRWYYGFDGQSPGGAVDLFTVVLHELAHALGFSDFTDRNTGEFARDGLGMEMPGVFSQFLYDNTTGKRWTELTPEQRLVSRQNNGNLLWDGPATKTVSARLSGGSCTGAGSRMRMYAPAAFAEGSSISHWDTTCTPDLLMEPIFTGRGFLDATPVLLSDLGWRLTGSCGDGTADDGEQCDRGGANGSGGACTAVCTGSGSGSCGDGIIGAGEQCDQGTQNGTAGSCCSGTCRLLAAATACRTGDECEVAAVCSGQSTLCPGGALARKPDGTTCSAGTCREGVCTLPAGVDAGARPDAAPPDTGLPDASPPDAASPPDTARPTDAALGPPDAALVVTRDAAAAPDTAVTGTASAGCSCDTAGRSQPVHGRPVLLLVALVLLYRRRRRGGRSSRASV